MENLKLILRLYVSPASAMSDLIDKGSWMFAAAAVLVVGLGFYMTVNEKLETVYHVPTLNEYYQPDHNNSDAVDENSYRQGMTDYSEALANQRSIPVVGDRFYTFFTFEPGKFYQPLLLLSIFYVPAAILLMSIFGGGVSFGVALRRDYGTLAVCTLNAWAAAHLPFALAGLLIYPQSVTPLVYLALWAASGLLFGVFMVFALRTVFGANYGLAVLTVGIAWISLSLGMYVLHFVGPWMFSPFLLILVVIYFGGFLGGEMRGFGNALRQRQNLKRFLHNATVNPKDADAHVQLGLIYLQRRQMTKALEHLTKAVEIDREEIDANYELGKLARANGDLQAALDHFAIVVEQNDKHALSEIWREIGATYLDANMLTEAHEALEKFVDRRAVDVEGLYYFGRVLKAEGETTRAVEVFTEAIASAKASPYYHRGNLKHWCKLAQKEM